MEKLKNIEFLRAIGCISIVLMHFLGYLSSKFPLAWNCNYLLTGHNLANGNKAVDLFFILSGLFFALKIAPAPKMPSLFDFVKKKVLRLWPVLIWCIFLYFIISFTGAVKFSLLSNIITFLALNGNGIALSSSNINIFWYVSAMLWVLILYFYLLKHFDKKIVNLTIALLIYFSYVFLLHAFNGYICNHLKTFCYVFNVGILRALGGIGVGYFIGEWYKKNANTIKNIKLSVINTIIVTILECGCLFFIIKNLIFHKLRFHNQIIFIIFFAAIIILFLINKGLISKALNNDFNVFLGKYTYSIYMTHYIIIDVLAGTVWQNRMEFVFAHPALNITAGLSAILFLGVLTYHCVEKPVSDYVLKKQAAKS